MIGEFFIPENLEDLARVLGAKTENTFIMAGGTDLAVRFKKDNIFDFNIIDMGRLGELKKIEIQGEKIVIGAYVTMTQIEKNKELNEFIPALVGAAASLGSTQIRNRATLGGNIANAAQCGDTLPVLFAYDARLKILNSLGEYRYEKIRDFIKGINDTSLRADEAIIGIELDKSKDLAGFSKVGSRKTVTIAKINCCGKFHIREDLVETAEIYMGAVGVKPIKASIIEQAMIGKNIYNIVEQIKEDIEKQIEKAIPDRNSKHYKKVAAIGVVEDMLNNLRR